MFDIKTPSRVYYLAADSEAVMARWVECVCRVCGLHSCQSDTEAESDKSNTATRSASPATTSQPGPTNPATTSQPGPALPASPYMHLSECFTGGAPPATPRHSSSSVPLTSTPQRGPPPPRLSPHYQNSPAPRPSDSLNATGDDSVFFPASPAGLNKAAARLAGLQLAGPARPPKPISLRQQAGPGEGEAAVLAKEAVETNNNTQLTRPPQVDRRLKPEPAPGGGGPGAGPPVERARKPRTDAGPAPYPGLVLPGQENCGWTEQGSDSDGCSRPNSSDEQIYFYMPSLQQSSVAGRWDPLLIPAQDMDRDNAVQYLDLDLPACPLGQASPASGSLDRVTRQQHDQPATVYKTVDFIKTEAFNRTRQTVEEYKYNIKQTK